MQRVFGIFNVVNVKDITTAKKLTLHEVRLADKTGTLKLVLKDNTYLELVNKTPYVEVLNAQAKVFKGFI